jgi:ABC-type glycerol-3-phosphate transport system permease component
VVKGNRAKKLISHTISYFLMALVSLLALLPFIWMVSSSFKTNSEIFTSPPVWIPRAPTLEGYTHLFKTPMYGQTLFVDFGRNSFFVSLTTAIITVAMAAMGAYGMSRFRFKGSKGLRYLILLSQMLPGALLLIPLYTIMTKLELIDNHWSLILAYISFTLPYCAYLLKSYIDAIPASIDEAALVDGCNRFNALIRVVFPVAAPGIVVTFVQAFIMAWNEYMFALAFINTNSKWTLPVALGSFRGQYIVEWSYLFAGSVLLTIPVLLLFLFFQKWLITGLSAGSVKG